MIDLTQLRGDAESLQSELVSMDDLQIRATLMRRRRLTRKLFSAAVVLIVVVVLGVVAVETQAPRTTQTTAPGAPYVGSADVAFQSKTGLVYVVGQSDDALLGLDPDSVPPFAADVTIPLGFVPGVVAVVPNGTSALVAPHVEEQGASNVLYEVNLATHRIVHKFIDRPNTLFGNVAIAPNGKTAYAWSNVITPIDLVTRTLGRPIVFRSPINDFVLSPSGRYGVAVTGGIGGNEVTQLNLSTGIAIRSLKTSGLSVGGVRGAWIPEYVSYSPDGSTTYAAVLRDTPNGTEQAGLIAIDEFSGAVLSTTLLGGSPAGIVVSPSGKTLYVLESRDEAHIYSGVLSLDQFSVSGVPLDHSFVHEATIALGNQQSDLLLQSPSGRSLYVVTSDWKVIPIDTRTGKVRVAIALPGQSQLPTTLQPVSG